MTMALAVPAIGAFAVFRTSSRLSRSLPAQLSLQSKAAKPAAPDDPIKAAKTVAPDGPIFGGKAASAAFEGFLGVWRDLYFDNDGTVPELGDNVLPQALHGVRAKLVRSAGGAAEGGVVTEAIGYGMMIEGVQAAAGNKASLKNGLALMKAWLGMVNGPEQAFTPPTAAAPGQVVHPLGGGDGTEDATRVDGSAYGVSAINPEGPSAVGPSGVAAWKYPINSCSWGLCTGSATDADEDAVFGMIYLTAALDYPDDFTDTVMRAVISVASADLGFPDVYRTLPDGTKVFVPKGGSMWGGLLPSQGRFNSSFNAGCVNPSYMAPAHYRLFRDFAKLHWKPSYDVYLPNHLTGARSTLKELMEAFDGAVVASYNLLERSTCPSGAVSNWAGSVADCPGGALSCPGIPWAFTPHVGPHGTCTGSGTKWGSWGKDACRAPWRIAMDYILYPEESTQVKMYDTSGQLEGSPEFSAKVYLNRLAKQYVRNAKCDGGKPGDCDIRGRTDANKTDANKLAPAFVAELGAPDVICHNVPNAPDPSWWAAEMSHPTFAGFVAPVESLSAAESTAWLGTFARICDFANLSSFPDTDTTHGAADLCSTTYFQASQQVISAMVTSGSLNALPGTPSMTLK